MQSEAKPTPIPLPQGLIPALAILASAGHRPLLVGGAVRDHLLGERPKDLDVEVFGPDEESLVHLLSPLGKVNRVGKSFGVVKIWLGDQEYDFSVPRRETKTATGHRGFKVTPSAALSIAEAASRRDFTINAIYYDPTTQTYEDPCNGLRDLKAGMLRHTSPAFAEDPLRVLRAFQFSSRFDFLVAPETIALCRQMIPEFSTLPAERVWGEWSKWACQSRNPARGLEFLQECGWLQFFPR